MQHDLISSQTAKERLCFPMRPWKMTSRPLPTVQRSLPATLRRLLTHALCHLLRLELPMYGGLATTTDITLLTFVRAMQTNRGRISETNAHGWGVTRRGVFNGSSAI